MKESPEPKDEDVTTQSENSKCVASVSPQNHLKKSELCKL